MYNARALGVLLLAACLLLACAPAEHATVATDRQNIPLATEKTIATPATRDAATDDDSFVAANGLRLPGSFTGTLPCADCEGISYHLDLWGDQVYHMRRQWLGGEAPLARDEIGHWYADPIEDTITLHGAAEMPLLFDVEGTGELRIRDISGQRIESSLDYSLRRTPGFMPVELQDLFMGGEFTYMADAAIFKECISNRSYPVAMEADYIALERLYLASGVGPAAPLYATIEGGIVEREAMEGPPRRHVVVKRVGNTSPTRRCEQNRATASLRNTYWKIESLMGSDVAAPAEQREPHLILRNNEEQRFVATVGCNQFSGSFEADDTGATFGAAMATRMACPPLLAADEQRLQTVLSAARTHRRSGETLALFDADGDVVAMLKAVYFR